MRGSVASSDAVARIETFLEGREGVGLATSFIGRNVERFYLPLAILPPSDNHSQILVLATDVESRDRLVAELTTYLAETFPEAISRVSPLELGPPVGWPVQYRLTGPDVEVLRSNALRLAGVKC